MLWHQSQKMCFAGSNNQEHYYNLHKRLSADFQRKVLLFKKAVPWSLRIKPGAAVVKWQNARFSTGRLGVRPTTSGWIAV